MWFGRNVAKLVGLTTKPSMQSETYRNNEIYLYIPEFPLGPIGPSIPTPSIPRSPLSPFSPGMPMIPGGPGCPGIPVYPGSPGRPGRPESPYCKQTTISVVGIHHNTYIIYFYFKF